MTSHRTLRVAQAIREVVASAVLFELQDPRVQGVTILRVDVAGDLRNATVYVSIMGEEKDKKLCLKGLESSAGFLQSRVAARLQTRYTPILHFKRDDSVAKGLVLSQIIDQAVAEDRARQAARLGLTPEPTEGSDASYAHAPEDGEDPEDHLIDKEDPEDHHGDKEDPEARAGDSEASSESW